MVEHNNLKEALEELYLLSKVSDIKVEGKSATIEDLQELYRERIINILDLVGHESVYLDEK